MPAAQSGSAGTGGHLLHVLLNRAQPCGFPMVHYDSSCPDLLRPILLTPVFVPRAFNSPMIELTSHFLVYRRQLLSPGGAVKFSLSQVSDH